MTILPRFEACVCGTAGSTNRSLTIKLTVRNNTSSPYISDSELVVAGIRHAVALNLPSRSEQVLAIDISNDARLLPGDNTATLIIPGEDVLRVYFTHDNVSPLDSYVPVELSAKDMIPDSSWNTIRVMPGFPHIFFTFTSYGWPVPMEALKDISEISVPQIPGLKYMIPKQQFIPVSHLSGNVSYRINLEGRNFRKLFLLVLPFVDNHNVFSEVARVSIYSKNEAVYSRTLCYPGDLDYWVPDKNATSFATFCKPRTDRFGLLPLLSADSHDWKEAKPPAFPQPEWWATCLPLVSESCLMNIIEINPGKPVGMDYMVFETLGTMPAFGIVAATGVL
jgi:hypothetical protein